MLGELEIKIIGFIKARLLEFVVASLHHHWHISHSSAVYVQTTIFNSELIECCMKMNILLK